MNAKIFLGSKEEIKDDLIEIKSPYSNKVVSKYPLCKELDAKKALSIAEKAKKEIANTTISQRVLWIKDVINKLRRSKDAIAKTITDEVGKPISFSKVEVDRCIETLELSITAMVELNGEVFNSDAMPSGKKTLSYFKRVPAGVVVAITPFNFPLNLIAHKIGPAIVAGNSVVVKPTPEAPLTAYKFIKMFIKSEYAVKDAISLVYGDAEVGNALVKSDIPRVISFTGSASVGNAITKSAGIKKISLELGGNAATYIDKTADLASAAKSCAEAAFYNSGQVCISLQRVYVNEEVYDQFSQMIAEFTISLKPGSPYVEDTFVGPLINEDAANRALNWVNIAKKEGAKALCGDRIEGRVFYPTVMSEVTDDMNIVCEEVFAPIVSVIKVKDFDEALKKINNSPYGLQYSIFTNDLNLAKRAIDEYECGGVVVNESPTKRFDIQPYGGSKLSGIGKEGPKYAIEEMTEIKSVVIF